jgi:hypothetical protein
MSFLGRWGVGGGVGRMETEETRDPIHPTASNLQ